MTAYLPKRIIKTLARHCEVRQGMHSADEFLMVDDAAQLTGYSHWTIRRWLNVGKLSRYRAGSRVVVSRSELVELVKPKKVRQ